MKTAIPPASTGHLTQSEIVRRFANRRYARSGALASAAVLILILLLAPALPAAENPFEQVAEQSYAGRFVGPDVTFRLKPDAGKWSGTIVLKGRNFTLQGEQKDGKLAGTYSDGDQSWPFTANSDGDNLAFTAGTFTSKLQRQKLPKLEGIYASKRVKLDFENKDSGLNGTIEYAGKKLPFTATESAGDLEGVFKSGDEAFKFTIIKETESIKFQTGAFAETIKPPVDPDEWRPLAEKGDPVAQNRLGICYFSGSGVRQDQGEAVRWYRRAAEQGNAAAQKNLGDCCKSGYGLDMDKAEAVRWYRKAADQGNAAAQDALGWCYWRGEGVGKDLAEAAHWFRKGAEKGTVFHLNNLAWLLATCQEPEIRNGKEAVELATKACKLSNMTNNYCLGTLAAAYAEAGEFEQAIIYAKKAIEAATLPADAKFVSESKERLKLYEEHKPYHEAK